MRKVSLIFIFYWAGLVVKSQTIDFNILAQTKTLKGDYLKNEDLKNSKACVFIFLSPECPLCQKYTLTINKIEKEFKEKGVLFSYVFPGNYYSKKEINRFVIKYKLQSIALLDTEFKIAQNLKATVTPEAFLVNSKGGILYSGKIDNWFESIGKRRTVITEFYLKDAINSTLKGETPYIVRKEPVGCLIENSSRK